MAAITIYNPGLGSFTSIPSALDNYLSDAIIIQQTSTLVETEDSFGNTVRFIGTGYTYGPVNVPGGNIFGVTGGTCTGFEVRDGFGNLVMLGSGFSMSASALFLAMAEIVISGRSTQLTALLDDYAYTFTDSDAPFTFSGYAFNDTLLGGGGNDSLFGGAGDDLIGGGAGADVLDGGLGIDTVSYAGALQGVNVNLAAGMASGGDTLRNFERVVGSDHADTLVGGTRADTLVGLDGGDTLIGGRGADRMVGGLGDDRYVVDSVGDVVVEIAGEGEDTVVVTAGSYTLAGAVENGVLEGKAKNLTGNDLDNELTGNAGKNAIVGGLGDDTLIGGGSTDVLTGGGGADTFVFADGHGRGDVVVDFSIAAGDVIDLSGRTGVDDLTDLLLTATTLRGVAGVTIQVVGDTANTIFVGGVTVADLTTNQATVFDF